MEKVLEQKDKEKVLEQKDKGQWYAEAEDGICNDYPHNKILFAMV